jgi:transcriptional regulator with XRE-family HTH domain
MKLGEFIVQERKRAGLEQKDLAKLAGVSAATVNRIEKGLTLGGADTVARIGEVLGIDPRVIHALILEREIAGLSEKDEIQSINLKRVKAERRPLLRRQIDALVREASDNQGSKG